MGGEGQDGGCMQYCTCVEIDVMSCSDYVNGWCLYSRRHIHVASHMHVHMQRPHACWHVGRLCFPQPKHQVYLPGTYQLDLHHFPIPCCRPHPFCAVDLDFHSMLQTQISFPFCAVDLDLTCCRPRSHSHPDPDLIPIPCCRPRSHSHLVLCHSCVLFWVYHKPHLQYPQAIPPVSTSHTSSITSPQAMSHSTANQLFLNLQTEKMRKMRKTSRRCYNYITF